MNTNITFTPEQLGQSAALLPDIASTSATTVELALDDYIHRHSEHYPHYRHYDIVPPRPVISFRRNPAENRWEFFGRVTLLPYELEEAQREGLDAWLRAKIGSRCAYLELGTPMGGVIPMMLFLRGAKSTVEAAQRGYVNTRTTLPGAPGRDRLAPPVPATNQGMLRPA